MNRSKETREARVIRILAAASEARFAYLAPAAGQRVLPQLVDEEGEQVVTLSDEFCDVLDNVNDSFALSLLRHTYTIVRRAHRHGYDRGHDAGRSEVISTVHVLLGIDKLAKTIRAVSP